MKTTIQISDTPLAEARKLAAREHTTVTALVEQGLRQIVAERKRKWKGVFRLRKATCRGGACSLMSPELRGRISASSPALASLALIRGSAGLLAADE
jgi:hypothetical protein